MPHSRGNAIVKRLSVNEGIRAREVLVIGENGEQLGVMPSRQALQLAKESNLDLVEVSATSTPPVCRILDYGKFKYQQSKKEREARKSQRAVLMREVRVRPRIKEHDLEAKVKLIKRLLDEGDKVKILMIFRGREITHPEAGKEVFRRMLDQLRDVALANAPQVEERSISLVLSPLKTTKDAKKEVREVSSAEA
ncbi:MAG: translation initiation factor IF-3 [Chloroflexota bacterium]|nr:translation initiation factor IF-3 [Chloroflexota bacterium]